MIFGGLGIELSRITSIEVGYYIPTSNKIIGSYRLFTGNYQFFSMKLESMIRVGLVFAWELK
jgi:hypothetical protein